MPEEKQPDLFSDMPIDPQPEPPRSLLADTGRLDPRRRHKKETAEKRKAHAEPEKRRKHGG